MREGVRLFDELVEVYGLAVLSWAGIDIDGAEAMAIARELAATVDGFAIGVGATSYPRTWRARLRTNRWAQSLIREVRRGTRQPDERTALARVAETDLTDAVAAVELLNIVRPTVAVAYFGAYAAQALDAHPDWKRRLATGSADELKAFEHEVRRWYPFTPLLTGRMVTEYVWEGRTFPPGSWMVLDVIGTNHDPRRWVEPHCFRPERFLDREPDAFDYVPHGGGEVDAGHRCPGEPLAVGILEATLRLLGGLDFDVADESKTVEMGRVPSLPPQHMELHSVHRTGP
ncbi:MAG: Fatty-acid peroxygenase [uncultured Nocardioidaceae bacterium]|uniref:Fatty-acid peroxygenase n=1 Tax=uncultured Nocardioidaceae bacterium TaxID=253824 RepID=A0A6J4M3Q4_9ACTN|nr:MAG: Fatty-acid peroxygenase [uncultured Nocardioidaceae bacterium]